MAPFKISLKRSVSAPQVGDTSHAVVAAPERTLQTLKMLARMGYSHVWCKSSDVDSSVLEAAFQQGWRIGDVSDGRFKFVRHSDAVPEPSPPPAEPDINPAAGRWRRPSEPVLGRPLSPSPKPPEPARTRSPTDEVRDPVPSPYARAAKFGLSAEDARHLFEELGIGPSAPGITVSAPLEHPFEYDDDGTGSEASGYFSFRPARQRDYTHGASGAWTFANQRAPMHKRTKSGASSKYSQDSDITSIKEVTETTPEFPSASRLQKALFADFQPPTPELRLGGVHRRPSAPVRRMDRDLMFEIVPITSDRPRRRTESDLTSPTPSPETEQAPDAEDTITFAGDS